MTRQLPQRVTHAKRVARGLKPRDFNYALDFSRVDFRAEPELYRVGRGEEGVLLVQPYKSEILPVWKFRTPADARVSSRAIARLFAGYKRSRDFVGMDMARKFMQMGFTRSRRYANHRSGRKYDDDFRVLPNDVDAVKAQSAQIFFEAWQRLERDSVYADWKLQWRLAFG